MIAALRLPAFRWLLVGQLASRLGTSVYEVGVAWTVYTLTGSAAASAAVWIAQTAPQLLLLTAGGVAGDRMNRRRVLIVSDLVAGVAVLVLAVVTRAAGTQLPVLLIVTVCLGAAASFFLPSYQPLINDLVPGELVQDANGVDNLATNIIAVAGPALGGLIYNLFGADIAFWINAASFAVAGAATVAIGPVATSGNDEPFRVRDATAGLSYIREQRWLAALVGLGAVMNLACMASFLVLLPKVVDDANLGVGVLGAAVATQGVAAALVTTLVTRCVRRDHLARIAEGTVAAAAGLVLLAIAPSMVTVCLAALLVGAGSASYVLEHTLLQVHVPAALLSRVYSADILCSLALFPVGAATVGLLADAVGVQVVLLIAAGLCGLAALALLRSHVDVPVAVGEVAA